VFFIFEVVLRLRHFGFFDEYFVPTTTNNPLEKMMMTMMMYRNA